jgi:hypothetical protein
MNDKTKTVPVRVTPEGASVTTNDGKSCVSPCYLELTRGKNYLIKISKENYKTKSIELDGKSVDNWVWGNILFGGVIGLGLDFATDKAYDFEPKQVEQTLIPLRKSVPSRGIASHE